MTQCKIYKCPHREGRPCCAECGQPCENVCHNHPDRCGCVLTGNRPGRLTYDHEAIYRLVLKGLTNDQVAAQIGCAPSTVGKVVRQYGIIRSRGGPKRGRK